MLNKFFEKMIKILPVEKIREADQYTIKHEPITSIDLMERASVQLFQWMIKRLNKTQCVHVFCGPGNNGGDGLALSRLLIDAGYDVKVYAIDLFKEQSEDYKLNRMRLEQMDVLIQPIQSVQDIPLLTVNDIVVDAIFGSGLNRPVEGILAEVFSGINAGDSFIVSVDVPSGLFADDLTPKHGSVIKADYTLSFEVPKLAFLLAENEFFVGNWTVLGIELSATYLDNVDVKHYLVSKEDIQIRMKGRHLHSHKGTYGHGLLIAGSKGKIGAALLSAKAALRSGLGLLSLQLPSAADIAVHASVPEVMLVANDNIDHVAGLTNIISYNAVAMGPGVGKANDSLNLLKHIIHESDQPLILDADALNMLAENKTVLSFLPKESILTPHPGEFDRLAGKSQNSFERIEKAKAMAIKYQIYVILKGAHTMIACPDGKAFFNPSGNPGMATAGSGDVLTGILLGLLCQGYSPFDTCLVGVYLHGLSGDLAAKDKGYNSLIASDIIDNLPGAFLQK